MNLKFIFTCTVLFFSIGLVAQSEIPPNSFFAWGKIKIPIHELINGSNGEIEVKLDEILASANEPIILTKNGKEVLLKNLLFIITHRKNNEDTRPYVMEIQDYSKKRAESIHGKALMKDQLQEGENIYLREVTAEGFEKLFLNISIYQAPSPTNIIYSENYYSTPPEIFHFQIEEIENQKTKVKLDTTNIDTKSIFEIYKKLDRYQIVHIPHFKTTRRYVTPEDFDKNKKSEVINLVKNEALQNINISNFSEFTDFQGTKIQLKWGDLIASKTYSIYDLEEAIGRRFILSQGFRDYNIVLMKVIISSEGHDETTYWTDDINHPELQKALLSIPPDTVILFSDILIQKNEKELLRFPISFFFMIK